MRPVYIFAALLVSLIWGGNFVAAKFALEHFPPFFLTALRFALAALILVTIVPVPNRSQFPLIARISLLNTLHFSLPYVSMSMGLSIASTSITAQLGVPFSCILGALFLKDRLGLWRSMGLATAFGGMFIVFGTPNIAEHQTAFFLTLAGAFFWATTNIMMKYVKQVGALSMMAWMSLFSAPQLFLLSAVFEPGAWQSLAHVPAGPLAALAYTVILSTIVAHGLWYHLLTTHPITYIAPFSLLVPVLGTLFGMVVFHEAVTWHIIVGGLVTLAGIAVIVLRRPKLATLEPESV